MTPGEYERISKAVDEYRALLARQQECERCSKDLQNEMMRRELLQLSFVGNSMRIDLPDAIRKPIAQQIIGMLAEESIRLGDKMREIQCPAGTNPDV